MNTPPTDSPFPDDPISPKDAARLLAVHLSQIYRWMLRGVLPHWRLPSGHKRVSKADVLALPKPGRPKVAGTVAFNVESVRQLTARRKHTDDVIAKYWPDLAGKV